MTIVIGDGDSFTMEYKSWEFRAMEACRERGLEVLPYGFEGGWVFVRNKNGEIFPVGEDIVAKWIKEDKNE